eukprot:825270-Rhodomonas_salina.2
MSGTEIGHGASRRRRSGCRASTGEREGRRGRGASREMEAGLEQRGWRWRGRAEREEQEAATLGFICEKRGRWKGFGGGGGHAG